MGESMRIQYEQVAINVLRQKWDLAACGPRFEQNPGICYRNGGVEKQRKFGFLRLAVYHYFRCFYSAHGNRPCYSCLGGQFPALRQPCQKPACENYAFTFFDGTGYLFVDIRVVVRLCGKKDDVTL